MDFYRNFRLRNLLFVIFICNCAFELIVAKSRGEKIDCDVTEIFCEEYSSCLSKMYPKDTCNTIIDRLKISCPEKTKFCIDRLICLPENQECSKKADVIKNVTIDSFDFNCSKNSGQQEYERCKKLQKMIEVEHGLSLEKVKVKNGKTKTGREKDTKTTSSSQPVNTKNKFSHSGSKTPHEESEDNLDNTSESLPESNSDRNKEEEDYNFDYDGKTRLVNSAETTNIYFEATVTEPAKLKLAETSYFDNNSKPDSISITSNENNHFEKSVVTITIETDVKTIEPNVETAITDDHLSVSPTFGPPFTKTITSDVFNMVEPNNPTPIFTDSVGMSGLSESQANSEGVPTFKLVTTSTLTNSSTEKTTGAMDVLTLISAPNTVLTTKTSPTPSTLGTQSELILSSHESKKETTLASMGFAVTASTTSSEVIDKSSLLTLKVMPITTPILTTTTPKTSTSYVSPENNAVDHEENPRIERNNNEEAMQNTTIMAKDITTEVPSDSEPLLTNQQISTTLPFPTSESKSTANSLKTTTTIYATNIAQPTTYGTTTTTAKIQVLGVPTTISTQQTVAQQEETGSVLLHYVTAGIDDVQELLAPNLPQSSTTIKVAKVSNKIEIGVWMIKTENSEYSFNIGNYNEALPNIVLTNSTVIYLKNATRSGVAQVMLQTWSQWKSVSVTLSKIVYPQTSTDEMNISLKISKMSVNLDDGPKTVNANELVVLEYSDNFRNLKQDVEELFDQLSVNDDKQTKLKAFRLQMSVIETPLGLCLSPVINPLVVGSIESENLDNHTKNSVLLSTNDKLCVWNNRYQISFRFGNGSSGTQLISVNAWNGNAKSVKSDMETLLTITVFSQKLKDSAIPAQSLFTINSLITPTVPYNLSDVGALKKAEITVNALVSQFYTVNNGKNNFLGMAVVSAGKGSYGQWQYMSKSSWVNFPSSFFHGMDIFKIDVRTRSNDKYSSFNLTEFKDMNPVEAFLLDGTTKIQFQPSNEKFFWSTSDAVKDTALAFIAWNSPNGYSIGDSGIVMQLDVPLCINCSTLQIANQGIVVYAQRFGCDGALSSLKIIDDCNVCGGTNQCYDCKNVPFGKSKWVCNVCTENGEYLKDCRGICNGTAHTFPDGRCVDTVNDIKGCDGDYTSLAFINECNYCVGGITNRTISFGKDKCGVCNGSNLCLGCDGIANSGKILDLCKKCLIPTDTKFNKGCGVKFGSISNYILNNTNQTVTLGVAGISESIDASCLLDPVEEGRKNFTLVTSKPQRKTENQDDFIFAIFYSYVIPGQYILICTVDGATIQFNQTVFIFDYNIFQISAAYPATVSLDDDPKTRKVKLTGNFPPDVNKDPFCLDTISFLPPNAYPASLYSSTEVVCDLSKAEKSTTLNLRVVPRNEMLAYMVEKQTPMQIKVLAKSPALQSANFGTSLADFTIYFDVNINGSLSCDSIFPQLIYGKLGSDPICTFSANELRVSLGSKCSLSVGEKISILYGAIQQANVMHPTFVKNNSFILLGEPSEKVIPQVQLIQVNKVTQCTKSIIISVMKTQGDGGRTMAYKWSLQPVQSNDLKMIKTIEKNLTTYLLTQVGNQIEIPVFKSDSAIDFDIDVVGCNFLKYCSRSTTTHVAIDVLKETLKLSIGGLEPPFRTSRKLHLSGRASLLYCDIEESLKTNIKYYWQVVQNDTQTTLIPKFGKTFIIPKFTYLPGQSLQVILNAAYLYERLQKNISATASVWITFEAEPIWIRLEQLSRTIGVNQTLILDASSSTDPNRNDNNNLQHSWTCLRIDKESDKDRTPAMQCYINSNGTAIMLEQAFVTDQSILNVPAKTVFPGIYNFTVTVRSGNLIQDRTVTVTYTENDTIIIDQMPLGEKKPNVNVPQKLQWKLPAIPNSTLQIEFIQPDGYGKCALPERMHYKTTQTIPATVPSNTTYIVSITLPSKSSTFYQDWQGLDEGTNYKVKLTMKSQNKTGESEYLFRTNKPPSVGNFELIPNSSLIKALETFVTLNAATGWTDSDEDLPLLYSFGVRHHMINDSTKDLWFPFSTEDSMTLQFPTALNSHAICNRIGYQVMVKVCDFYGACTMKIIPDSPFQVQTPDNTTASVESILDEIEQATTSGELLLAYQKVQLLLAEFCDNMSPNLAKSVTNVASDIMTQLNENMEREETLSYLEETVALLRPNLLANEQLYNRFLLITKKIGSNFGIASQKLQRKKRAAESNNIKSVDASSVSQLLSAYEIILQHSHDLNAIVMYLGAVEDASTQLCINRDPTMEPAIVQATTVTNPVGLIKVVSILLSAFLGDQTVIGPSTINKTPFSVELSKSFQTKYQAWSCNRKTSICNDICIVQAQYDTGSKFSPLDPYFYRNISSATKYIWSPLSKIYFVTFEDPFTGAPFVLDKTDSYSLWIPGNISSTNLYKCKIFDNNAWLESACETNKTEDNGTQVYVYCSCSKFGYISVFEAPLPPLNGISVKQAANVTFVVTNGTFNGVTIQTLANAISVSPFRLVDFHITFVSSGIHAVWFVLKPPQTFDVADNSFVVYKLNRTLNDPSTFKTYFALKNSLTVAAIEIANKLDNDPRNVTVQFINSCDGLKNKTYGNEMLSSLTNQVIQFLEIKTYRLLYEFTNLATELKTCFNFIIQSASTSKEISSEVAANRLKSDYFYGDKIFTDTSGAMLTIDVDGFTIVQIGKLSGPEEPYDPMPTIVGSVIGSIFFLVIVIVIILVIVKQKNRVEKISPDNSPPHSGNLINGSRGSAQRSLLPTRRVSVEEDPRAVPTSRRYQ